MTVHTMLGPIAAALFVAAAPMSAAAQTVEERLKRADAVIRDLNRGQPQPALERMRQEFPVLAEATEAYALGDVWARPALDARTRQLAAVAAGISRAIAASQVLSELFAERRDAGKPR